jgi:hypothetical protein
MYNEKKILLKHCENKQLEAKKNCWNEKVTAHYWHKWTVLPSNEWKVGRDYNYDLWRWKNWLLDRWKANRPATSLHCRTAPFRGSMNHVICAMKINPQKSQARRIHTTRQKIENDHHAREKFYQFEFFLYVLMFCIINNV